MTLERDAFIGSALSIGSQPVAAQVHSPLGTFLGNLPVKTEDNRLLEGGYSHWQLEKEKASSPGHLLTVEQAGSDRTRGEEWPVPKGSEEACSRPGSSFVCTNPWRAVVTTEYTQYDRHPAAGIHPLPVVPGRDLDLGQLMRPQMLEGQHLLKAPCPKEAWELWVG